MPPDFASKTVVEIGCGFGALCVKAAQRGAEEVLGVELDGDRAEIAHHLVHKRCPDLAERIGFTDYPSIASPSYTGYFDIVLSQNAFEHYADPEAVLKRMVTLLRPEGHIYAGFGPLWHSPFGSHLKSVCAAPWGHLWAGRFVIRQHNRLRSHAPITSFHDIGLNQAPLRRYHRMFHRSDGCKLLCFCENWSIRQRSPFLYAVVEFLRAVPFLREYLTASLFVVLRKVVGTDRRRLEANSDKT